MAIVCRGMTAEETAHLTAAMVHSGAKLDLSTLPGSKVDKHSTGGVGDKTSLILAPLAAACGVVVPMMSGRGLGHTGGTLDKLESIPGFRVNLSLAEFRTALEKVGFALIGQTAEVAPADKVLYALRDVTATVESIPLISASIMSKKIAEGIDGLVLDVKCGQGAFMKTRADARRLADSLVQIGSAHGVRPRPCSARWTNPLAASLATPSRCGRPSRRWRAGGRKTLRNCPSTWRADGAAGRAGGNAARGRGTRAPGPDLGPRPGEIPAPSSPSKAATRASSMIPAPPQAPHCHGYRASRAGFVLSIDADKVGRAAMLLGAGRNRAEESVDPAVGVLLLAVRGEEVSQGHRLAELCYSDAARLPEALTLIESAFHLGDEPPSPKEIVLETRE